MNLDNMHHTSLISSSIANSNDRLHSRSRFLSRYSYDDSNDNNNNCNDDNENDENNSGNNNDNDINNNSTGFHNLCDKDDEKDDDSSENVESIGNLVGVKRGCHENNVIVDDGDNNDCERPLYGNDSGDSLPYHFFPNCYDLGHDVNRALSLVFFNGEFNCGMNPMFKYVRSIIGYCYRCS